MVDVETDGEIPGKFSIIEIGAIVVEPSLSKTFLRRLRPISDQWNPEALKISGYTREETLTFDDPLAVMLAFEEWVKSVNVGKKAMFISDNNGFDFMHVTWYAHHFLGRSIFGHSSTNLGSLYKGLVKDTFQNFKHLRKTKHTHNPLDDARGNAEALLHMKDVMGLKIALV